MSCSAEEGSVMTRISDPSAGSDGFRERKGGPARPNLYPAASSKGKWQSISFNFVIYLPTHETS